MRARIFNWGREVVNRLGLRRGRENPHAEMTNAQRFDRDLGLGRPMEFIVFDRERAFRLYVSYHMILTGMPGDKSKEHCQLIFYNQQGLPINDVIKIDPGGGRINFDVNPNAPTGAVSFKLSIPKGYEDKTRQRDYVYCVEQFVAIDPDLRTGYQFHDSKL